MHLLQETKFGFKVQYMKQIIDVINIIVKHDLIKNVFIDRKRRSQWPRGLRHELSSPAHNTEIVGSNPTGGMDVCVCSVST
jgi:hypothetical protein